MAPLVFLENIWYNAEHKWPESKFVAQTTLSPVEAAQVFTNTFLDEGDAVVLNKLLTDRKELNRGEFLTYRSAFSYTTGGLKETVLFVVYAQGGAVKLVELWDYAHAMPPRVIEEKEARAAFDKGALVIAVDFEYERKITAYAWKMPTKLKIMFRTEGVPKTLPTVADDIALLGEESRETRERIERARRAILNSELW